MKNRFIIPIALVCLGVYSSCTNNNKQDILAELDPCDTNSTTYSAEIKPILDQFCNTSGCHDAASMAGGYNLSDYNSLQPIALGNRFMGSIKHKSGFSSMPKGGAKLANCQIEKIEIWVRKGAQNN